MCTYMCVCIRAFHFYSFVQFRLAFVFPGYNNVLVYVEDPFTEHDVLGGKLY